MFEKKFQLRYFEMDKHGQALPVTVIKLFQETAADHCHAIEYGLFDLLKQNIGWILLGGFMQMDRYPHYKENVTIRTWLSQYRTFRGLRENLMLDEDGNIIGRARGLWLFYDIERRRPVRIFDEIQNRWSCSPEKSSEQEILPKNPGFESGVFSAQIRVNRGDIDTNKHVNNLRYFQWLMETIPEEITDNHYLHSINGRFQGEAQYGNTIESLTRPNGSDHSFLHAVTDADSRKTYATARTVWSRRN